MLVAGNWKMHGSRQMAAELVPAIYKAATEAGEGTDVVLFPPSILLPYVVGLAKAPLKLGGQDCHGAESGAYTGDTSAAMLKEAGASYVLVGHSERRLHHDETNENVRAKARMALTAGLIPVICVGETVEQREGGITEEILERQLEESIPATGSGENIVVAYEPVWAIGTGKVATPQMIAETHHFIREHIPTHTKILYGGSVKPSNVAEILAQEAVHGVLVGGASLTAENFCPIIEAAAHTKN